MKVFQRVSKRDLSKTWKPWKRESEFRATFLPLILLTCIIIIIFLATHHERLCCIPDLKYNTCQVNTWPIDGKCEREMTSARFIFCLSLCLTFFFYLVINKQKQELAFDTSLSFVYNSWLKKLKLQQLTAYTKFYKNVYFVKKLSLI